MAEVRTHGAGGKDKLLEVLGKRRATAGGSEEHAQRLPQLLRGGCGRAERYSSMADDAALSEVKREAAMLFSAAEGHLEAGDTAECRSVAEAALKKFQALGAAGKEGVADCVHVTIDAHRLDAYRDYADPEDALALANEYMEEFKAEGDRRGEATMKLALAEIATDNARLEKRQQALELAMDALAIAKDLGDRRLQAKCWVEATFAYFSLGDSDKMAEAAESASAIYDDLGDTMGRATAAYATGLSRVRKNDWEGAAEAASLSQQLFARLGRPSLEAGVSHASAVWRLLQGQPKKAVPLAERALELTVQEGRSAWQMAVTSMTLCEALAEAGSAKAALKVAHESLRRLEVGGGIREQAMAHEALALAHLAAEAPTKAAAALQLAVGLAGELGAPRYESRLLLAAAAVQARLKQLGEAEVLLERAAELARGADDMHQLARAQRELCALQLLNGAEGLEAAADTAASAASTARLDGDRVAEAAARLQQALCHALHEEHSQAVAACGDAEELCRDAGYAEGEAQALWLTAEVRAADSKLEEAIDAARARLAIAERLEDSRLQVRATTLLVGLLVSAGHFDEAERAVGGAQLLAQDADDARLQLDVLLLLVRLHLQRASQAMDTSAKAQLAKAAKAAGDAVQAATGLGEKGPRGMALYWKAQVLLSEGRYQDAQRMASDAEALFRHIQSDQGQGACLHLSGALHAVFGQADRALDTMERALAFAQAAKDGNLEYEVSMSIHNVQRQLQPQQQAAAAARAQQLMMPVADEGAASEAGAVSMAPAQPKGLDPGFVRKQLMIFVREVVASEDELELDSPFMDAGLDSLSSVALMSMVAKEFQMALSPSLVFDFPTVRALEDHLVEESKLV